MTIYCPGGTSIAEGGITIIKSKNIKPRVIIPEMKPLPYDLVRQEQNRKALEKLKSWKEKIIFTLG